MLRPRAAIISHYLAIVEHMTHRVRRDVSRQDSSRWREAGKSSTRAEAPYNTKAPAVRAVPCRNPGALKPR